MKPSSSTIDKGTREGPSSSAAGGRSRGRFDGLFASPAMAEVFSDRACVQGLLDFESALARAEAAVGVIPPSAAEVIASQCRAELFDVDLIAQGAALAGNLAIPVIRRLTELVAGGDPDAARWVHWGATSQDAVDTGSVLQLRSAIDLLDSDLLRLSDILARLAQQYRHAVMLGRTWLQPGPPITFGLKAAGWLDTVGRQRDRMAQLRARALVMQFGGAVGTLASLAGQAVPVATRLGQALGLGVPDLPWHAQRDRVAETGAVLGLLAGSLGKMARDLSLLMQAEVAEVSEPRSPGRGGSSTMPHKHNPIGAATMLAAATRVPALVAALLSAMPQEHERGLGGWQAEWETLPEICRLTAGALRHSLEVFGALEVDPDRMRANIDRTLGIVLAEPVALALTGHMDRGEAHSLVEQACRRAMERQQPLREVLREDPEVTSRLSALELDHLCDPSNYLGATETCIDRVLAAHHRARESADTDDPVLDVPGATLHYRLQGSVEAPVVVLASSLGTTLAMWDGQIAALARDFRVLRFDMRGHGTSSLSTVPVDVPRLGRDVLALLDAIKATSAHFLGLSLGGMVGLWLGAHAPERVGKLVLANTAALIGPAAMWDARIESVARDGVEAIAEGVIERWFSPKFREEEPRSVERLRQMLLSTDPAGYLGGCAAVREADLRESVANVRTPTLVITGELDTATPPSAGRWLVERIAGARHLQLKAAHLSNIEAEPAFNQGVLGFLSA
jgi:3-carboxy-cis,cis-muconate cycloisomerase